MTVPALGRPLAVAHVMVIIGPRPSTHVAPKRVLLVREGIRAPHPVRQHLPFCQRIQPIRFGSPSSLRRPRAARRVALLCSALLCGKGALGNA